MTEHRSTEQMSKDRQAIVDHLRQEGARGQHWVRPPSWAKTYDIAWLVKSGYIERQVRDRDGSDFSFLTGGSYHIRHRTYIRLMEEAQ